METGMPIESTLMEISLNLSIAEQCALGTFSHRTKMGHLGGAPLGEYSIRLLFYDEMHNSNRSIRRFFHKSFWLPRWRHDNRHMNLRN